MVRIAWNEFRETNRVFVKYEDPKISKLAKENLELIDKCEKLELEIEQEELLKQFEPGVATIYHIMKNTLKEENAALDKVKQALKKVCEEQTTTEE